jgi:hypothetical protein
MNDGRANPVDRDLDSCNQWGWVAKSILKQFKTQKTGFRHFSNPVFNPSIARVLVGRAQNSANKIGKGISQWMPSDHICLLSTFSLAS